MIPMTSSSAQAHHPASDPNAHSSASASSASLYRLRMNTNSPPMKAEPASTKHVIIRLSHVFQKLSCASLVLSYTMRKLNGSF